MCRVEKGFSVIGCVFSLLSLLLLLSAKPVGKIVARHGEDSRCAFCFGLTFILSPIIACKFPGNPIRASSPTCTLQRLRLLQNSRCFSVFLPCVLACGSAAISFIVVWSTALEKFDADRSHNVDGSVYISPDGTPVPDACGYGGPGIDELSEGEGFAFFILATIFQILSMGLMICVVRNSNYDSTEA